MIYYSAKTNWRKLKLIFESKEIRAVMLSQMEQHKKRMEINDRVQWIKRSRTLPEHYDICDWRINHGRGRYPAYWDWVCHSACHFMAPVYLLVIRQCLPGWNWSLLSGDHHSTVYCNEKPLKDSYIFDPQYEALGLTANEAWKYAKK